MSYEDYIDEYVVDGFFSTITCSLNYFMDNTDPELNPEPLFKAKMELQVYFSSTI
jgi:dynein heavy chain